MLHAWPSLHHAEEGLVWVVLSDDLSVVDILGMRWLRCVWNVWQYVCLSAMDSTYWCLDFSDYPKLPIILIPTKLAFSYKRWLATTPLKPSLVCQPLPSIVQYWRRKGSGRTALRNLCRTWLSGTSNHIAECTKHTCTMHTLKCSNIYEYNYTCSKFDGTIVQLWLRQWWECRASCVRHWLLLKREDCSKQKCLHSETSHGYIHCMCIHLF